MTDPVIWLYILENRIYNGPGYMVIYTRKWYSMTDTVIWLYILENGIYNRPTMITMICENFVKILSKTVWCPHMSKRMGAVASTSPTLPLPLHGGVKVTYVDNQLHVIFWSTRFSNHWATCHIDWNGRVKFTYVNNLYRSVNEIRSYHWAT